MGFGQFEQLGLVAFDLQKVVSSLFDHAAGGLGLAVEGVGGDGLAVERGDGFEQFLGGLEFAAFGAFLLVVGRDGLGAAVLVSGQGDQPYDVSDHLAVQG